MSDISSYVLPNGFTFLASTAGSPGYWSRALDPVTAARNAARVEYGLNEPEFVQVWYVPHEHVGINDWGQLAWSPKIADQIIPIGFFKLTTSTMRPSKDKRLTHEEWMADQHELFGSQAREVA